MTAGKPMTTLLTMDEYAALPEQYDEDGRQLKDELIEGELILSPRASWTHAEVVTRLLEALRPLERLGCRVIGEGALPIYDEKSSVLGPDVMVVSTVEWYGQQASRAYNPIKPYVAIEVVSPGNRLTRMAEKTEMILGLGALQVWWLYPEQRRVDVHTQGGVESFTGQVGVPHPAGSLVLDLEPIFDFSKTVVPIHEAAI